MLQEEEREEMCHQRGVQTAVKHHGSYEQPQEAGVSVVKHNTAGFVRYTLVVILGTSSSGHPL